jgi:hypothetical protein
MGLVVLRRSEFEGRRECDAVPLEPIHGVKLLITAQAQDDRVTVIGEGRNKVRSNAINAPFKWTEDGA